MAWLTEQSWKNIKILLANNKSSTEFYHFIIANVIQLSHRLIRNTKAIMGYYKDKN